MDHKPMEINGFVFFVRNTELGFDNRYYEAVRGDVILKSKSLQYLKKKVKKQPSQEDSWKKSNWSVDGVDDFSLQHDYPSARKVVYTRTSQTLGKLVFESEIQGKTWLDLYKAANKCIVDSGDLHHVFIEGFNLMKDGNLELFTGS